MRLRLTDGSDYDLVSCTREFDPATNDNVLVCEFADGYDFNEVSSTLKKFEIAEILTVYEDGKMVFQSKDYTNVLSVTNNVKTKSIIVKFSNKRGI